MSPLLEFSKYLKPIIVLLVSFLIIIFSPLGLFLSFPLFLLRYLISKSSRLLRPDLGKMLTTRGTLFASDNFTTTPHGNILLSVTLQGKLDLEKLKDLIQKNVLDYQPKYLNGELKYPELRQYLTKWCGYLFWKDDKQFDLNNHVKLYKNTDPESQSVSDSELEELRQELVTKKWDEGRPLWEFLVVHTATPNLSYGIGPEVNKSCTNVSEMTVILVRCHHSLGDGNSWRHLIRTRLCCVPEPKNPPAKLDWKSVLLQTLFVISLPIRSAYELADFVVSPLVLRNQLPFRKVNNKSKTKRDFNVDLCDRISINVIKDIKNHFGVSFFSVVLAILAGALREFMTNKGYKSIPKSVPLITPLPLNGHSYKLRNFMSGWYVSLPVGEVDVVQRLRLCQKSCDKIGSSAGPLLFKYIMPIGGGYFASLTKLFTKNRSASLVLSNFPLALENLSMNGHLFLDAFFSIGPQPGIQGVGFCGMSYSNGYRISPFGVSSVISREELSELTYLIQKQTQVLLNCTKVLEV